MEENNNLPAEQVGQNVSNDSKRTIKRLPLVVAGVFVVIVFGGWFAYNAYASPKRAWQKYFMNAVNPSVLSQSVMSETFSFSYVDNGKVPDSVKSHPDLGFYTNIKFSLKGDAYLDRTDLNKLQMSSNVDYSFGSGNTIVTSSAKLISKDKDIFLNLGSNPFVNSMMFMVSPEEKVEWIKLNFEDIQKALNASKASGAERATQKKQYQDILNKHLSKVFILDKFIDRQTLHGEKTFHYSNTINKPELKVTVSELTNALLNQVQTVSEIDPSEYEKTKELLHKVVENFVDRFQPSMLESWISTSDYSLRKIKINGNAPSWVSLLGSISDVQNMNLDDKRQVTENMLKGITFDGQFALEEDFFDYGKKQEIKIPENALDVAKKIHEENEQQKTLMQDQVAPVRSN